MLTSIGDVMRESFARGLITTRDGNISIRRKNTFYITPSGVRKNKIEPEHIIKASIKNNKIVFSDNKQKPSGELRMHELLQTTKDFKGYRTVLHIHPTYIIAAIHAGFDLQKLSSEFPEVSRYTRVGPNVRTLPVTSDILAEETFSAMTKDGNIVYDIVGQSAHGVCVIAATPWDAFEHVERLEHICQIVLASGVKPNDKNRIL